MEEEREMCEEFAQDKHWKYALHWEITCSM